MRFEKTPAFDADWGRLSSEQRRMFKDAARRFSDACDRYEADPGLGFPEKFRVKAIRNAKGIFEMTWSFSGPDGRATWELVNVSQTTEPGTTGTEATTRHRAVRWRRVGDHSVFKKP